MVLQKIKIGKIPGAPIQHLEVEGGTTIEKSLQLAHMETSGFEIRLNGKIVDDLQQSLQEGDSILVVRKIQGNK